MSSDSLHLLVRIGIMTETIASSVIESDQRLADEQY